MAVGTWVAIVVLFIAYGYLLYRFRIVWPDVVLEESRRLADAVPNRRKFADFALATVRLDATEHRGDAAVFLGDQVSKLYDEMIVASASLDAKATTILGFVGGGVSLYALTVESKAAAQPSLTPLLVLSALFFLGSLLACLGCLYTRFRHGLPEVREELAKPEALDHRDTTAARVAAYLFVLKQDRLDLNRPINVYKTMYVELAHYLFAFGAIAVVLNYGVVALSDKPAPSKATGQCVVTTTAASTNVACTNKGDSHGP